MEPNTRQSRFAEAYKEMAVKARYRPEAPSDGLGTVLLDPEDLENDEVLEEEARRYGERLRKQDDDTEFVLHGCTNFDENRLFVYLLNAAGLCFGGTRTLPIIKRLAQLALNEISSIEERKA